MSEVEITSLEITGHGGKSLPNRFFRQRGEAQGLAVLFPGLNYTCDMPLLYYPRWLFTLHGMDALQVWADYTRPEFQALSRLEQAAWLGGDAQAAVQAGWRQRSYARLVLVGKSIGTLALAHLAAQTTLASQASTIWLTPLLRQPHLVEAALRCTGPALFACGTGDATYDPAALERIQAAGAQTLVLERANHSLEVPGEPFLSLRYLEEMLKAVEGLLGRGG
jgi:hypothetical protein